MKKILCIALCLSMLLPMTACTGDGQKTIKVFNWGDYINESVLTEFTRQTGINVIYDTFNTNEDMYTKVKLSSGGSYDVVIPSDYMISKMINEDMLVPLNRDNIPNFSLINDRFKNLEFDPGNVYSVPYMWGTLGIVYNTTMVDDPVISYDILWNKKYDGQIFMMDSSRDSIGIALLRLGYSTNTLDDAQLEEAKLSLIEQKPLVLAYTGDEVKDKMVSGEAALAVVYSGDAMTICELNEDIAYAIPEAGTNLWFDNMCILKTTKCQSEAEQFINFMCSTEIAGLNRDAILYATPQKEVFDSLPDEVKNDPLQYPGVEYQARCYVYKDSPEINEKYNRIWDYIIMK